MRQPDGKNGSNELVGLSQPLDFPYFRTARRQVAEAGIAAGEAMASDTRLNQITAVKQAFFDLLRRQAEARLTSENHDLLLQIRSRVGIKVNVGESPRYELVKAEAEVLAAKSAVRSSDYRVTQARDRLKMLIGSDLPANFTVADEPLQRPELPGLDDLRSELLWKSAADPFGRCRKEACIRPVGTGTHPARATAFNTRQRGSGP